MVPKQRILLFKKKQEKKEEKLFFSLVMLLFYFRFQAFKDPYIPVFLKLTDRIKPFKAQDPYSPTFLENVLCLILQTFLYEATFECNTTADWLNQLWFSHSAVVLHSDLQNRGQKKNGEYS